MASIFRIAICSKSTACFVSGCVYVGDTRRRQSRFASCQSLPKSASTLRAVHELQGPQQADAPPDPSFTANSRPTRLVQRQVLTGGEIISASLILAASKAATDLSTYWSNSVRPYALLGSPFLRPAVAASIWCISLEIILHGESNVKLPASSMLVTSANVKAAHERRALEVHICSQVTETEDKLEVSAVLKGLAWCIASKSGPRLEGVRVPPVPASISDTEESSKRWLVLNERSKIRLVKRSAAEATSSARTGVPSSCWLSDSDGVEKDITAAYGRQSLPVVPPVDACGDVSAILSASLQTAFDALSKVHSLHNGSQSVAVDAEFSRALPPSTLVELCARVEPERKTAEANARETLVSGWVGNEVVLRLRVRNRNLPESGFINKTGI